LVPAIADKLQIGRERASPRLSDYVGTVAAIANVTLSIKDYRSLMLSWLYTLRLLSCLVLVVVCSLHKIYRCKTLIPYLDFLHYLYYWADVRI